MDKELLKGCKNSVELIFRLIDHHGYLKDPWELGVLQLAAHLAREKLEVDSNLALCQRLIEDLYPEARRLFVKPTATNSSPTVIAMQAGEVAMIEYFQSQSQERKGANEVAQELHKEYGTPKRLNVKYSQNSKNPKVREMADQLLRLMEEHEVDFETLVQSYLNRKT